MHATHRIHVAYAEDPCGLWVRLTGPNLPKGKEEAITRSGPVDEQELHGAANPTLYSYADPPQPTPTPPPPSAPPHLQDLQVDSRGLRDRVPIPEDSSSPLHADHSLLCSSQMLVDTSLERDKAGLPNTVSTSAWKPHRGEWWAFRSDIDVARLLYGPLRSRTDLRRQTGL